MATRYTDTEQSARNSSRLDRIGRTDERARRCSRVSTRSNPRCERVQLEQKASFVKQRRKGVNPLRPRGRFFYLLSLSHRQGGPTIKPFSPSLSLLSPPLSLSLSLSLSFSLFTFCSSRLLSLSFVRSATIRSLFSSFFLHPPFLFVSSEPARILNRDHYLRAIIIPKTNSYFLLRNRKLINQSSLLSLASAFGSFKSCAVPAGL